MLLSTNDRTQYSLTRALLHAAKNKGQLAGCFEADLSTILQKEIERLNPEHFATKKDANGFFIPTEILMGRGLSAVSAYLGGNTVQTGVGDIVPVLRSKSIVAGLGAQIFDRLKGDLQLPRQTLGATLDWLAENQPCNTQNQNLGYLTLTPHQCSGAQRYTKQLLDQTAGGIEAFVRNDLLAAFAAALDKAALVGTGAANQPTGLANQPDLAQITFGGAATTAKITDFESAVADANADIGSLGWAASPAVREKWRQKDRSSGNGGLLWSDQNTVLGYPAKSSRNLSDTDQAIFGNWEDLIIGIWGDACEILVNPFSYAATGTIEIIINYFADVGALHPGSFAISTDSGAQ